MTIRLPAFVQTIRFRLTLWYSSLLLVFGVAFVVALNIAVRVDEPHVVLFGASGTAAEWEWRPVDSQPGRALSGFVPAVSAQAILRETEAQIRSENLDRLQTWSIAAIIALALSSGVGGYVLSGLMLRPVRDITQVASEISASNLNRRLNYQGPEDELKQLADTFDSMIARLEDAFERQRRFVQDASHELRTPLAAIRTTIEVAELEPELSREEYEELLRTVKAQTERLTRLSEDLLLLSSSEEGTPELEPLAVERLVAEVVDELRPLAEARGVSLVLDAAGESHVRGNASWLQRCVANLVDNAIKYGGSGGEVVVRVLPTDSSVRIEVRDFGPGIPPEALPHVFERFFRVDKGRSRREGGSGLGLAIVAELVRAMGGRVSVDSRVGQGSTFVIELPKAAQQL